MRTCNESFGVVAQLVEVSCFTAQRSVKRGTSSERKEFWGCSSVGRASALQAEGRQFESDQLHQNSVDRIVKFAEKGVNYIMVKVLVRDNNVEQALRVAKRKSQKEGLYREMKERQRYEKPTTKRKRLKEEAVRNEKRRQSKQRMVFGF